LLVDLRRLKKKLDFETEVERSVTPDSSQAIHQSTAATVTQTGSHTSTLDSVRPTSSAEYLVSELKQHKNRQLSFPLVGQICG
jgi:hypothetical protein